MSASETSIQQCDIRLVGVHKSFGMRTAVLINVGLEVRHGEFAILAGPSGAGKSTLLRLLYGALRPEAGEVVVLGRNLTTLHPSQLPLLRRQIGVIFQDFKLLVRRTAFENVAFSLRSLGVPRRTIERRVRHLLTWVGLGRKLTAYPAVLSGGEQQRVAVARAMASEPKLLLADEPTGNLDPENALEILNLLRESNLRGATVLLATHDPLLRQSIDRRVIEIDHGKVLGGHVASL